MSSLTSDSTCCSRQPRWPVVAVVVFAAAVVGGLVYLGAGVHRKITTVEIPADWQIPDIVKALNDGGMGLHPVPQHNHSAFLCEDETKDYSFLRNLRTNYPPDEPLWDGIVVVTKQSKSFPTLYPPDNEERWLITDSYSFYGDARLINRIRVVLSRSITQD